MKLGTSTHSERLKTHPSLIITRNIIMILHTFGDHDAIYSSDILVNLFFSVARSVVVRRPGAQGNYFSYHGTVGFIRGTEAPVNRHKCYLPAVMGRPKLLRGKSFEKSARIVCDY